VLAHRACNDFRHLPWCRRLKLCHTNMAVLSSLLPRRRNALGRTCVNHLLRWSSKRIETLRRFPHSWLVPQRAQQCHQISNKTSPLLFILSRDQHWDFLIERAILCQNIKNDFIAHLGKSKANNITYAEEALN
jgi:hypothetical protein